jgi:hypothetical protein
MAKISIRHNLETNFVWFRIQQKSFFLLSFQIVCKTVLEDTFHNWSPIYQKDMLA